MSRTQNRKSISELVLRSLKPKPQKYLTWDSKVRGLVIEVQPTGRRTWKFIYGYRGRSRWFTIGDADAISITDARVKAGQLIGEVANDRDPQSARKQQREAITFKRLAQR